MKIKVNGTMRQIDRNTSVQHLLTLLGMEGDRVAVELNREILPRSSFAETVLKEDDSLEIVQFVGGG